MQGRRGLGGGRVSVNFIKVDNCKDDITIVIRVNCRVGGCTRKIGIVQMIKKIVLEENLVYTIN